MGGEATLDNIDEQITTVDAECVAAELFGRPGTAVRLVGERDQNFRLRTLDGDYLLKISNSAEDPLVTDLQTQALLHVEQVDSQLPTPRVIPALGGESQSRWVNPSGVEVTVRLLTFLPGEPLYRIAVDDALRSHIGSVLARFDRALAGFSHPADRHELLWDTQHAERVKDWLWAIDDRNQRDLSSRGLSIFEELAMPKLPFLPDQVIHNDFNPYNILVDSMARCISGMVDMGDAMRAPRSVDLAVAAAYHVQNAGEPLEGVAAVVAGYNSVQPLLDEELDVIVPLIIGRLAMTTIITAWRANRHPENREYILKNAPLAWAGLARLANDQVSSATDYIRGHLRRLAA